MLVEIRAITPDDMEGFHHVYDVVAKERRYLSPYQAAPLESFRTAFLKSIENRNPLFIAVDNRTVVGWCEIERLNFPMHSHVGDLAIGLLPEYRGLGYGLALLKRTMAEAFALGIVRITLGVFAGNRRAIDLYRKAGFVQEGLLRDATCIDGKFGDMIMMAAIRH